MEPAADVLFESTPASGASRALQLRVALLGGLALVCVLAFRAADPAGTLTADPALARLLRGMALIKGAGVVAAAAAVFWRCGWRMTIPVAMAYIGGTWVLAATTIMIWQLSLIPLAAAVFHGALIAVLVAAWRDDAGPRRRQRGSAAVVNPPGGTSD